MCHDPLHGAFGRDCPRYVQMQDLHHTRGGSLWYQNNRNIVETNTVETRKGVGRRTDTPREIETETDTVTHTSVNDLNNQILNNSDRALQRQRLADQTKDRKTEEMKAPRRTGAGIEMILLMGSVSLVNR